MANTLINQNICIPFGIYDEWGIKRRLLQLLFSTANVYGHLLDHYKFRESKSR